MRRVPFVYWVGGVMLLAAVAGAEDHQLKLDLDPLLEPGKMAAFTAQTLEEKFTASGFKENPFIQWNKDRSVATFSLRLG
jgi:hypothetical protein